MTDKVVGIGAGGHVKIVIEILRAAAQFQIHGLTDTNTELHGDTVLGIRVLGGDGLLPKLKDEEGVTHFFVALGGVGNDGMRKRSRELFDSARAIGLVPVTAIHPSAVVSPTAKVDEGTVVAAGAVINSGARVGKNVIINTGAIVEHDCVVADHVHVASGAKLGGAVKVDEGAHIGAGATVIQCINVGKDSVIGAGSAVINDVPPEVTVVGCPAKQIKDADIS